MEHVKKEAAIQGFTSDSCTVIEYPSQNPTINIAIATLKGRYPEKGYAYNEKSTELAYCLKGRGKIVTQSQTAEVEEGDTVIIPSNERYFWEGNMTILLSCSPAWQVEQHKNEVDLQENSTSIS